MAYVTRLASLADYEKGRKKSPVNCGAMDRIPGRIHIYSAHSVAQVRTGGPP